MLYIFTFDKYLVCRVRIYIRGKGFEQMYFSSHNPSAVKDPSQQHLSPQRFSSLIPIIRTIFLSNDESIDDKINVS